MINTKLLIPAAALVFLGGGALAGYASYVSADSSSAMNSAPGFFGGMMRRGSVDRLGVHGTVKSVSGSTITLTGKDGNTYAVDVSGASFRKFTEGNAVSENLADIVSGDEISVHGTVSGTSVKATEVIEGLPFGPGLGRGFGGHMRNGVMGKVTDVSGSNITVRGIDGKTYTVSAGQASVRRMVSGTLSDVTVGDTISVMGSVDGQSVTAKTIMDDVPEVASQ
jgi:hypothetical protein